MFYFIFLHDDENFIAKNKEGMIQQKSPPRPKLRKERAHLTGKSLKTGLP